MFVTASRAPSSADIELPVAAETCTLPVQSPSDLTATPPKPAVLVIDDDALMRLILSCFFGGRGFQVTLCSSLSEAKLLFGNEAHWAAVICDYQLRDGTGLELYRWIQEGVSQLPPFLFISGTLNPPVPDVEFLAKPFTISDLEVRTQSWLAAWSKK